jgi:ABC-type sugar transport system permease subunit
MSFLLALALNSIKFKGVFRSIFFFPAIVLSGPVMYQLLDAGNFDSTLIPFSLQGVYVYDIITMFSPFLASFISFIFENFVVVLWFTGIPIILFINGIQKIPYQVFEAARIDGATSWQVLWKVTIPLVKPIGLTVTVFTIVQLGVFTTNPVFDLIATQMMNMISGFGHAATYAVVYSIIILMFIGISLLVFRTKKADRA